MAEGTENRHFTLTPQFRTTNLYNTEKGSTETAEFAERFLVRYQSPLINLANICYQDNYCENDRIDWVSGFLSREFSLMVKEGNNEPTQRRSVLRSFLYPMNESSRTQCREGFNRLVIRSFHNYVRDDLRSKVRASANQAKVQATMATTGETNFNRDLAMQTLQSLRAAVIRHCDGYTDLYKRKDADDRLTPELLNRVLNTKWPENACAPCLSDRLVQTQLGIDGKLFKRARKQLLLFIGWSIRDEIHGVGDTTLDSHSPGGDNDNNRGQARTALAEQFWKTLAQSCVNFLASDSSEGPAHCRPH